MAAQEPSQWIFTEEEVLSAPSILEGLDPVEERCRRAKGVNFITQAGILLKLPQLTIATASVFFHRFFMRQTMMPEKNGPHHYNIAATSLFLATKTEENCRKTREIVVAVAKVAQKNPSLIIDEQSKEYWRWRDSILLLEEHMLELLTFDLVVKTPHIRLLDHLQRLQIENNKALRNTGWAFLNDSCMTPLCLLMPAADISITAIYFAVKLHNETLPDVSGMPWWEFIGGDPVKIVKAVGVLNQFWLENPLKKNDNPYNGSPSSQDDLDRTRRRDSDGNSSVGVFSENGGSQRTSIVQELCKIEHTTEEDSHGLENSLSNEAEGPSLTSVVKSSHAIEVTQNLEKVDDDLKIESADEGEINTSRVESQPIEMQSGGNLSGMNGVNGVGKPSPAKRKLEQGEDEQDPQAKRSRSTGSVEC